MRTICGTILAAVAATCAVEAAAGMFRSVENMPSGWEIVAKDNGVRAKKTFGLFIFVR
jgi:hypothetical protein